MTTEAEDEKKFNSLKSAITDAALDKARELGYENFDEILSALHACSIGVLKLIVEKEAKDDKDEQWARTKWYLDMTMQRLMNVKLLDHVEMGCIHDGKEIPLPKKEDIH